MTVITIFVLALSLGQSGWAQEARAQTVPTLTYTPAPRPTAGPPATSTSGVVPPGATATDSAPPATQPQFDTATPAEGTPPAFDTSTATAIVTVSATATATVSADLAACGPGPYTVTASADGLLQPLMLSSGALTLLSPEGLVDPSDSPTPLATFVADTVPISQLPAAPPGWQFLSCGLRATATDPAGQPVSFLTRGLVACMLADNADPAARLAYFDVHAGINRWVFLPIRHTAGPVCSMPFHLLATFGLLSPAP
jgi:hypothetical protein